MADVLIFEVCNDGDDVLRIRGSVDGAEVTAYGWVSATTNCFGAKDYQDFTEEDVANKKIPVATAGRHLKADAVSHVMTPDEARAYCEGLLLDAVGNQPEPQPLPAPLTFPVDPEPAPQEETNA